MPEGLEGLAVEFPLARHCIIRHHYWSLWCLSHSSDGGETQKFSTVNRQNSPLTCPIVCSNCRPSYCVAWSPVKILKFRVKLDMAAADECVEFFTCPHNVCRTWLYVGKRSLLWKVWYLEWLTPAPLSYATAPPQVLLAVSSFVDVQPCFHGYYPRHCSLLHLNGQQEWRGSNQEPRKGQAGLGALSIPMLYGCRHQPASEPSFPPVGLNNVNQELPNWCVMTH